MSASILVADDEPNIVLSLEFLLKQAGFRVRTVSDGEAALSLCANDPDRSRGSYRGAAESVPVIERTGMLPS